MTLNHTSGAFTCTLTGTPDHADANTGGTVQISIKATDNQGNQTSHTYNIDVLNVDNALSGAVTISNASGRHVRVECAQTRSSINRCK